MATGPRGVRPAGQNSGPSGTQGPCPEWGQLVRPCGRALETVSESDGGHPAGALRASQ